MRRLAQFVRLLASRVSRLSASVCVCLFASVSRLLMLRVPNARVCVCVRLCASVHVKGSECVRLRLASVCVCVRLRLCASASMCVCVCLRLCASASMCVCVYVRLRLCASAHVKGFRMLASVCVGRRSSCLASVCPCECLRELAHFMRRSSFKEFKRWGEVFAIVILYIPLLYI